jgi:ribosome-associated protein
VGKLMREVDPTPILARFAVWDGTNKEEALRFQQLERQRDLLLDSDEALSELIAEHPGLDVQALRSLVRAARREREKNAALPAGREPQRKHYRALFQAVKSLNTVDDSSQELDDE